MGHPVQCDSQMLLLVPPAFVERCRSLAALLWMWWPTKDFSAILGLSKCQYMLLCVIISLTQLILHRLVSLKQFRIHLKDPEHGPQTRTKISKCFFHGLIYQGLGMLK